MLLEAQAFMQALFDHMCGAHSRLGVSNLERHQYSACHAFSLLKV